MQRDGRTWPQETSRLYRRHVLAALALPTCSVAAPAKTAASKMATSIDAVEKTTWYQDKSTPKAPLRSIGYLYFGKKTAAPWLRFRLQYFGDDWLFVSTALIVVDGEKQGQVGGRWERDHSSGKVWEVVDIKVDASNVRVVRALAAAKTALIRFEGRKYIHDFKVPAADLQALKNVLAAFEEMGGAV